MPLIEGEGKRVRLISGALYGARSPVRTFSGMFYADVSLDAGARLTVLTVHEGRAAYVVENSVLIDGATFGAGQLVVFKPRAELTVNAASNGARPMLLGGAPTDAPRRIWWNIVSSSRERIEQAKADWHEGKFGGVSGETEFVPLPETRTPVVPYP